jgi:hypothetical protein
VSLYELLLFLHVAGAVVWATPAGQELIRRTFVISRIDLAFMYAILFAMTVKPTGDDVAVVLVAALVLAALTAAFFAQLRRGDAPLAQPAD